MNFLVLIGIIASIKQHKDNSILKLKIEESKDSKIMTDVDVLVDNEVFLNQLKKMKTGDIVGIKGRVAYNNNLLNLVCERLQSL
jgi:lysyl-tRNA synthetase class II